MAALRLALPVRSHIHELTVSETRYDSQISTICQTYVETNGNICGEQESNNSDNTEILICKHQAKESLDFESESFIRCDGMRWAGLGCAGLTFSFPHGVRDVTRRDATRQSRLAVLPTSLLCDT